MSVFLTKLLWYQGAGKVDPIEITDFTKIQIKLSQEIKNNKMDITISNVFDRVVGRQFLDAGRIKFQIEDKFKLYARYDNNNSGLDTGNNSNDLIFFGDLIQLKSRVGEKSAELVLTCTDRTFSLLNGIVMADYKIEDGWTAPLMVRDVVYKKAATNKKGIDPTQLIYDNAGNLVNYGTNTEFITIDARLNNTTNNKGEHGFIQDDRSVTITKSGATVSRTIGTPDSTLSLFPTVPIGTQNYNFPFKKYWSAGKPVYEVLLDLSQIDMTNTDAELDPDLQGNNVIIQRSMRFYIDELNRFHWFYPTNTVDTDKFRSSLDITMGTTTQYAVKNHDLDYEIFDVVNYIYYECGTDMNGDTIIDYAYDSTSGSPVFKDAKRSYPKIASGMKRADKDAGHITGSPESGYSYPTVYPVTPAWNTDISVNSDADYNIKFREKAKELGALEANKVINGKSSQRWKGKIEFDFYNFTITDLIKYTSSDGGILTELLRITDLTHNISKSGGFTTLTVEADEKELNT